MYLTHPSAVIIHIGEFPHIAIIDRFDVTYDVLPCHPANLYPGRVGVAGKSDGSIDDPYATFVKVFNGFEVYPSSNLTVHVLELVAGVNVLRALLE